MLLAEKLLDGLRFSMVERDFRCGYCTTHIIKTQNQVIQDHESIRWERCPNPNCGKLNIFVENQRVYPAFPIKHLESEIPATYTDKYQKSFQILSICPEASAASSRKCLELILTEEFKIDSQKDLCEKINLIQGKLSPVLFDQLHYLREIGNFGAHPRKNTHTSEILPVEVGEAEYCLDLLLGLFDECFVKPKRRDYMKKNINEKLKQAGKKTLPI